MLNRGVFIRAQKHGKRVVTRHLVFLIRPNEVGWPRLGLIVSRKVGCAVVRNRVKRVIREVFRLGKPLEGRGLDIIVIPRPSLKKPASFRTVAADFEDMERRVESKLQEAGENT